MSKQDVELQVDAYGAHCSEYRAKCASQPSGTVGVLFMILFGVSTGISLSLWAMTQHNDYSGLFAVLCAIAVFTGLANLYDGYTIMEESLMVIPASGIQLTTTRRNGARSTQFIELSTVSAVIINEAITFDDVVYYLAFTVDDSESMVLPFPNFRLRISVLQELRRQIEQSLFQQKGMQWPSHLMTQA